jgi:hypothetical protein
VRAKRFTVNDAIEQLQSDADGNWIGASIFTSPPDVREGSDEDSGDELKHLGGNQLLAECELVLQPTVVLTPTVVD